VHVLCSHKRDFLCHHHAMGDGGCYVFIMSRCPNVTPMRTSASLLLHTNAERIFMKFGEVNHYHQQMNWLHFVPNCTRDRGAWHETKFESTSSWCCHIANYSINFTIHTACWSHRAGKSITCHSGGIIWPH